jgi:hypothetical protein
MTFTPPLEPAMNVPSNILEADLRRLASKVEHLERKVALLTSSHGVPAALPVDKMQLADYAKNVVRPLLEEDEDEEEEVAQPNLTKNELQELASAVRDYLEWSNPQSHLSQEGWQMVSSASRDRLERAVAVAEKELRRAENA